MRFLTSFEMTISQLGVWEEVGSENQSYLQAIRLPHTRSLG